ncbi:hypothetical protein Q8W71_26995 [Methylobacterium sp. NEAU 140]|uniref:ABC-three component system middle component 5 n=1 Tax=Methylobacterium sp. NEAU 140 TaxID=3064945 RepID=UPI00273536D1|nr:ABC-three component system middle component 5 [Methylobacterium sp. NEAU 140]MDP4026279.1 hypothetical protein [Methylobacterium sp. NEAU 140]
MIQLTFQPALDPFHTVFRYFRLRDGLAAGFALQYEKFKIMDFYLVFPFLISSIRLSRGHQKYKKMAEKYGHLKPYGELPDPHNLFSRMEPMHDAAAQSMVVKRYFSGQYFTDGEIKSTERETPNEILVRVREANQRQDDLMGFMNILLSDYDTTGPNGLKARTGLIEYRYDTI